MLSPLLQKLFQKEVLFFHLFFVFTFSYGQIQEKYFYDQEPKEQGTVTITTLIGTDIILGGTTYTKRGKTTTLTKINQTGSILWVTELSITENVGSLITGSDGFIYAVASTLNNDYLFKVDANSGSIIWNKQVNSNGYTVSVNDYASDKLLIYYASDYNPSSNNFTQQFAIIGKSNGSLVNTRFIAKVPNGYASAGLRLDQQGNIYCTLKDTLYSFAAAAPYILRWKRAFSTTVKIFQAIHINTNNKIFAIGVDENNIGKVLSIDTSNGDLLSSVTATTRDVRAGAIKATAAHLFVSWKPIYFPARSAWKVTKINMNDGTISWNSSYILNGGQLSATNLNDDDFSNDLVIDGEGNILLTGVFDGGNYIGKWGIMKLNKDSGRSMYYTLIPGNKADIDQHKASSGISVFSFADKVGVIGNIQTYGKYEGEYRTTPEYATLELSTGTLLTQSYIYGDYEYPSKIVGMERDGADMIVLKQIGRSLVLGKYDAQQTAIWEKTITEEYALRDGILKRTPSGKIAIVASLRFINGYEDGVKEVYSYFFEPDGSLIWRKTLSIYSSFNFSSFELLDLHANDNASFIFFATDRQLKFCKVSAGSISPGISVDMDVHLNKAHPYVFNDDGFTIQLSGKKNGIGVRIIDYNQSTLASSVSSFVLHPAFSIYAIYKLNKDEFIISGAHTNNNTFILRCNLSDSRIIWVNRLDANFEVYKIIRPPGTSYVIALGKENNNYTAVRKFDFSNGTLLNAYTHESVGWKNTPTDVTVNETTGELIFSGWYQPDTPLAVTEGMLMSLNLLHFNAAIPLLIKGDFEGNNMATQVEVASNGATWMGGNKNTAGGHKAAFIYTGTLTNATINAAEPVLVSVSPKNLQTVKTIVPLIVEFNKSVTLGTGKLTVFDTSDRQLVQFSINSTNTIINGSTVTITPPSPLPANTTIYLNIDGSAFKDLANRDFAGIKDKSWTLYTDSYAPAFLNTEPYYGAYSKLFAPLEIIFNENVSKGSGALRLYKYADQTLVATVNIAADEVTIDKNRVTITLPTPFSSNSAYYVNLDAGTFIDKAGNSFAGLSTNSWNFRTAAPDKEKPLLIYPHSTDTTTTIGTIHPLENLTFFFNEKVKFNSGHVRLYDKKNDALLMTLEVNSNSCTSCFSEVMYLPHAIPLPEHVTLYIQIDEGTFIDQDGNSFAGLLDKSWTVVTQVNSFYPLSFQLPASNSLQVSLYTTLVMQFTQEMIPFPNNGSISIVDYDTDELIMAFKVNSENTTYFEKRTYTDLPKALPSGRHVYVKVDNGAFITQSISPRKYYDGFQDRSWHFTTMTMNNQKPALNSKWPEAGAANIATNTQLRVRFSEKILARKGDIHIYYADTDALLYRAAVRDSNTFVTDSQATISLPALLPSNTSLYIKADSSLFVDYAGNNFAGIYDRSWAFSTGIATDSITPLLTSYTPAKGASNIKLNSTLQIQFSNNIAVNNGSIRIINFDTDKPVLNVKVSTSNTTISGSLAVVELPGLLPSETKIYIQIEKGTFTDFTGNAYQGINDKSWYFTTVPSIDSTGPKLISHFPLNGDTNVGTDISLSIDFSEPVMLGNGAIRVFNATTNVQIGEMLLTSTNSSITGTKVIITPTSDFLPSGTTLYIKIDKETFRDTSGNSFAGISDKSWSFMTSSTADKTAPLLTSTLPASGSTESKSVNVITLFFNEPVLFKKGEKISIFEDATNEIVLQIALQNTNTTISENSIIITLPQELPLNKKLFIQIPSGAIADNAGNSFSGIFSKQWTFTIQQVITATENYDEHGKLIITREGATIVFDPQDSGIVIQSVIDLLGRKLDYVREENKLIIQKPNGIIILQGLKNNNPVAWKLFIN